MPPLNLASRPFRNERLPALLLALGFTVAGAITVRHAIAIRALMPGRTSGIARQVAELESEGARLRAEASSLRGVRPEPAAVAQWTLLKELVDRRTFAWSGLFAVLEEALPTGVRLVSISPRVEKGVTTVNLSGVAQSNEDILELIRALEDRPEFDEVIPKNRSGEGELSVTLTMRYLPTAAAAVAVASNAPSAPDASPSPPASPAAAPSPSASSPSPPPPGAAPRAPKSAGGGRGRGESF